MHVWCTLATNHKPLLWCTLATNHKPCCWDLPILTAAVRLQCWALLLAGHNYDIQFKPTQKHRNPDGLLCCQQEVVL